MRKSPRNSSFSPVKQLAPKSPFSIMMRIVMVGSFLVASVALAFVLMMHLHTAAYADLALISTQVPTIHQSYGADPWDVKFDKSGHVWVAEPQCDANVNTFPVCTPPPNQPGIQSGMIEYSVAGFSNGAQPLKTLT